MSFEHGFEMHLAISFLDLQLGPLKMIRLVNPTPQVFEHGVQRLFLSFEGQR